MALQVDNVDVDARIELGAVVDGAMRTRPAPGSSPGTSQRARSARAAISSWPVMSTTGTSAPAVFWDIRELTAGDQISVIGEDGKNYEYAVQWIEAIRGGGADPEVIPTDFVGDTGRRADPDHLRRRIRRQRRRVQRTVGGACEPDLGLISRPVSRVAAPARPIGRAGPMSSTLAIMTCHSGASS